MLHNKQGLEQTAPLLCISQSSVFLGIWAVKNGCPARKVKVAMENYALEFFMHYELEKS